MPAGIWSRSEGDGPSVLFLHGWTMDHHDERATYDALFAGRGYRRIYLDLPGMGHSRAAPVPEDLDGFADVVAGRIDDLLGEGRFLLSGTSAGALIARGVAARMPGRVRGLLMRVPLIVGPDDQRRIDPVPFLHEDPALMAGLADDTRALLAGPPIIQTRDWIAALADKLASRVLPAMSRADDAALAPLRADPRRYGLRQDLSRFDAPALVIAARQDDNVGWRDAVARLADWPRATLAVLDGAGHEFPLAPQMPLLAALVHDWLDRVELAG